MGNGLIYDARILKKKTATPEKQSSLVCASEEKNPGLYL
jgi:hypothetical protein